MSISKAAIGLVPTFFLAAGTVGTQIALCEVRNPGQCSGEWGQAYLLLGVGATGGGLAVGYGMENPAITTRRRREILDVADRMTSKPAGPPPPNPFTEADIDAGVEMLPVPDTAKRMARAAARLQRNRDRCSTV
jgi:hypothetical protein